MKIYEENLRESKEGYEDKWGKFEEEWEDL